MREKDVVIIGGGAAGLAAAASLAALAPRVTCEIVEKSARAGRKLAASGNGQGNIGNEDMDISHYFGSAKKHAGRILGEFSLGEMFPALLETDQRGRIYPAGRQASSLTDMLLSEISSGGSVTLTTGTGAATVSRQGDMFETCLTDGEKILSNYVILCPGGKAQRQYMTDGSAYALAEGLSHSLTPLYPAIVQLRTDTKYTRVLRGIRADCLVSLEDGEGRTVKSCRGDIIFTDCGISGSAAFFLSSYAAGEDGLTAVIDFLPGRTDGETEAVISRRRGMGMGDDMLLSGSLHNRIAAQIAKKAKAEKRELLDVLRRFDIPVTGTLGFDFAQVTRGGIKGDEVTDDLESIFNRGLFFAGEILDIDGECGGYNLFWAFASGSHVARVIAEREKYNGQG